MRRPLTLASDVSRQVKNANRQQLEPLRDNFVVFIEYGYKVQSIPAGNEAFPLGGGSEMKCGDPGVQEYQRPA